MSKNNLPLVVDPVRRIAIAVTSGSETVGDPSLGACPTTKYPKGPVFVHQVQVNRRQLVMFPERSHTPLPIDGEFVTWLLMVRSEYHPKTEAVGEHVAFCELSLPAEIDEEGYVTAWAERIVLEPVRLDQSRPQERALIEEEIIVPVSRRR
ncbi:MAG: hypothetical protein U0002_15645 [Thermoanaerobaculia bacterium]